MHTHQTRIFLRVFCHLDTEYNHNHPLESLQALNFRNISEDVSNKIKLHLEKRSTPGSAYKEMLQLLKQQSKDDLELHLNLADFSKMPKRRDFNNLYTEFHRKKFGTKDVKKMFENLEGKQRSLNSFSYFLLFFIHSFNTFMAANKGGK